MIDSIKHSAVLSRCHSHCLLIHGQRNCLIKVSSTVSPWRESDFVRLSSCLNGNVDRRSCPPERPFTPAQVFYLFWLMSPPLMMDVIWGHSTLWTNKNDKGGIGPAQQQPLLHSKQERDGDVNQEQCSHIYEGKNAQDALLPFLFIWEVATSFRKCTMG